MNNRWIVVVQRAGARIYQQKSRTEQFSLLQEFSHPEGRLKNRELGKDKPGRSNDNCSATRHSYSTEQLPHEHDLEVFLRQVSDRLDHAALAKEFDELVIAAEPHVLGLIKKLLPEHAGKLIKATIAKDLYACVVSDLQQSVEAML